MMQEREWEFQNAWINYISEDFFFPLESNRVISMLMEN